MRGLGEEDAKLVAAARGGCADAFGPLVRRYEREVVALAYSILGDRAEARDMAQEAFVRAYGNLHVLADPARFGPWLRRIVFGTCIDRVRAFRPELYRGDIGGDDARIASSAPTALERLEHVELVGRVVDAIARLPERYRVPLTLFHIDGLSHDKVAAALGVSLGTARSLTTRARRKLAALLQDYAGEDHPVKSIDSVFDEQDSAPRLLHVLNGDETRYKLEKSDVPGTFAVWADVLHDGPVPGDIGDDEWQRFRSRFIESRGWATYNEALEIGRRWDRGLASYPDYDEVVLWFEHDLFDQLILIRHLDWFARRDQAPARLSLICIGAYPGVERFIGLGQLTPDQLASLLGTRQPVTHRQIELGRAAWRAFTSADPTNIERILERDTSALPFLAGALQRQLEEFPAVSNGSSRSEHQILTVLERGPLRPFNLFPAAQQMEERPFMGDTSFFAIIHELAAARHPLVRVEPAAAALLHKEGMVSITPPGRDVLDGSEDHVRLNGIDRWIGGVRLRGEDSSWRWEAEGGRLVRAHS